MRGGIKVVTQAKASFVIKRKSKNESTTYLGATMGL